MVISVDEGKVFDKKFNNICNNKQTQNRKECPWSEKGHLPPNKPNKPKSNITCNNERQMLYLIRNKTKLFTLVTSSQHCTGGSNCAKKGGEKERKRKSKVFRLKRKSNDRILYIEYPMRIHKIFSESSAWLQDTRSIYKINCMFIY